MVAWANMEGRKYVGKRECNRGDGEFAHHPDAEALFHRHVY